MEWRDPATDTRRVIPGWAGEAGAAGLTALVRELLSSSAAGVNYGLDVINPFTPIPPLREAFQRQQQIASQLPAVSLSPDSPVRELGADLSAGLERWAQNNPRMAQGVASVVGNEDLLGALTLADATGIVGAPIKALAKAGSKAFVDDIMSDTRGGLGEALLAASVSPEVAYQSIIIPAEMALQRARNAGPEYAGIADEIETGLVAANVMLAQGVTDPREISQATGLQILPEPKSGVSGPGSMLRSGAPEAVDKLFWEIPEPGASFEGWDNPALNPKPTATQKVSLDILKDSEQRYTIHERVGKLYEDSPSFRADLEGAMNRVAAAKRDPGSADGIALREASAKNQLFKALGLDPWVKEALKGSGIKATRKNVDAALLSPMLGATNGPGGASLATLETRIRDRAGAAPKELTKVADQRNTLDQQIPRQARLADAVQWPLLHALVPEIADVKFRLDPSLTGKGGWYDDARKEIQLEPAGGSALGAQGGRIHELTHAVEQVMGMPRGGSPRNEVAGYAATHPEVEASWNMMLSDLAEGMRAGAPTADLLARFDKWDAASADPEQLMLASGEHKATAAIRAKRDREERAQLRDSLEGVKNTGITPEIAIADALGNISSAYGSYRGLRGEAHANASEARFGWPEQVKREIPMSSSMTAESWGRAPILQTIRRDKGGPSYAVGEADLVSALMEEPAQAPAVHTRPRAPSFRGGRERAPQWDVYDSDKTIAREAEANVADESPLMKVIGTSRAELEEIARNRYSDPEAFTPGGVKLGGSGSANAQRITTPSNEGRLIQLLDTVQRDAPRLTEGMVGWYVMDPAYRYLAERYGAEEALRAMRRTNQFTAPHSAGSPVSWEVQRGILARDLAGAGRMGEWTSHGGRNPRALGFDEVPGHPYTKSQTDALVRFLETGDWNFDAPKVDSYLNASDPLDPQSAWAIGDAHWVRGIGLGDVRTNKDYGASATGPEIATLGPWFRDLASALERPLPGVPAQALQWGALAKRTGVQTKVGAPKLEFFLDMAAKLAKKEGIPFEKAIERVFGIGDQTYYDVR